jgi:hypothetical protein
LTGFEPWAGVPYALTISETNRAQLVLFCIQNRASDPYSAAIDRILISLVDS